VGDENCQKQSVIGGSRGRATLINDPERKALSTVLKEIFFRPVLLLKNSGSLYGRSAAATRVYYLLCVKNRKESALLKVSMDGILNGTYAFAPT